MKYWKGRDKREFLFRRDGNRCRYCGKRLRVETSTIDHVVPRALGGPNNKHNWCLACLACNQAKGCQPPHVFLMMRGIAA